MLRSASRALTLGFICGAALTGIVASAAPASVTTTQENLAILTVHGDAAADVISVRCPAGNLRINSADPPAGPVKCDRVFALTVTGGSGDDRIDLSGFRQSEDPEAFADVRVLAGAGDDRVLRPSSYGFEQPVLGGRGDDVITGGVGTLSETTLGGPGNDTIVTGDGSFTSVSGGPGDDRIDVPPLPGFADVVRLTDVRGGPGSDRIKGSGAGDRIDAGSGPDVVRGSFGDDLLVGGSGRDVLYGNRRDDRLHGGPGRDRLLGGRGRDRIFQLGRGRLGPLFPDGF